MVETLPVTVHEIATDGLPNMDELTGRVAFIFDGCIVSGWPLEPKRMRREGIFVRGDVDEHAARGDVLWESSSDVGNSRLKSGITHWVEFPVPVWEMAAARVLAAR